MLALSNIGTGPWAVAFVAAIAVDRIALWISAWAKQGQPRAVVSKAQKIRDLRTDGQRQL